MYTAQIMTPTAPSPAWEPTAAQSGKESGQESGVSFQTLLEQRTNPSQKPKADSEGPAAPQDGTPDRETGTGESKQPVISMDLAALGAVWLAGGMNWSVPAAPVQSEPQEFGTVPAVLAGTVSANPAIGEDIPAQAGAVPDGSGLEPASGETPADAPAAQQSVPAAAVSQEGKMERVVPAAQEQKDAAAFQQRQDDRHSTGEDPSFQVTEFAAGGETRVFSQTEHMPVKVGEAVDTTAPAPQLEQALEQNLSRGLEDGAQHLEIRLTPEHLGTVEAEFTRAADGTLHVVLRAENSEAAKLLGDHAGALGALLQDSTHGSVRVEVPQPQQEPSPWQQPDQQSGQQQQQQQHHRPAPQQEAESFLHQLRLGLTEAEEI